MKHVTRTTVSLLCAIFAMGCGGDTTTQSNDLAEGMEQTIAEVSEAAGLKNAEQYAGKLDQLLTAAMVEQVTGLPADKGEKKYFNSGDARNHYLTFKYPSDRTDEKIKKMTGLTMPADDIVSIGSFSAEKLSNFQASWKQVTEEDVTRLKNEMEKQVANGSVSKESAEIAIGLSEGEVKNKREPVEGIGTAAVWVEKDKRLMIYHKGVSFYLNVETGKSSDEEKVMAIALANKILPNM
jgi:hypothetical protein